MRIILFTGKGGVGKTTTAGGTAAAAAASGLRTLVMSTDPAHSLADAFGVPIGAEPTPVADNLFVQQVDAQRKFERSWTEIQGYLLTVLDAAGVDPIAAEELTVLPGAEEVLALLELRDHAVSKHWDVIVIDCAPTAETLRLLALPEALGWYMERLFPMQRRMVKVLKPVLAKAAGVPMPDDAAFGAFERFHRDLEQVREIMMDKSCSVRLVLTPESVVVAEARRSLTTLSLFGYQVDGVIANRVFPAEGADPWRAKWVEAQNAVLAEVEHSFAGLPIWRSAYQAEEPVGVDALADLAGAAYGADDPLGLPPGEPLMSLERTESGARLKLMLPFVAKSDVDLVRRGDELVVTVGSYRRLLALPAALRQHSIAGAGIKEGTLTVRFLATTGENE